MIIKFPTAQYRDVIPRNPADSGNVTFVISNELPPRSDLVFPKLPIALLNRQRRPPDMPEPTRRRSVGDLAITISKATRKLDLNSARQFEIGQILEFNEFAVDTVDQMLVPGDLEIRHDLNLFDLDKMGLDQRQQQLIADQSADTQRTLTLRLNEQKRRRADAEATINNTQKLINELTKTIKSLNVVIDLDQDSELKIIAAQLQIQLQEARFKLDAAIAEANDSAQLASSLTDSLRQLGFLVR